jgi:hypothetical protein
MTYGMSIEDKLDNWAKYSTAGQKAVLEEASWTIRKLRRLNKTNNDWGITLFQALENLYNDYASYYPSAIENSPAMKAAYELINEDIEEEMQGN